MNEPTANNEITRIWNRNFICVMVINLLHVLAHFSVNTQVASYVTHLGSGALLMGFLAGFFFGISLAMRPIAGPVMTKIDNRKLIAAVFILGGTVNIGYALFHSIPVFLFFRFFNGVQYSLAGSLMMTLASNNLPKNKLASGIGLYGLGGAVGGAIGPVIGAGLLELGKHISSESLGFTFVFSGASFFLLSAVIPCLLLKPENKTKEDIKSTGAWYKNIATVYAVPMTIVMTFLIMSYALFNTYMIEFGKEQRISGIAMFYTIMAAILAFTRPMSGWLTDRLGITRTLPPAMILFAVSFLIVGFSKSLEPVLIAAVIAAIGFGSSQPGLLAMCMQTEARLKSAVASNTVYIGIDLGFFMGPFLGSIVFKYSDYSFMFKTASVPVALAVIMFFVFLPAYYRRRKELENAGL